GTRTSRRAGWHKQAPLPERQITASRVKDPESEPAAGSYAGTLKQMAGTAPVLDWVHRGLGPDGHTASLVPDDPVLNVIDRDVAITGGYQGRKRMTLTYPVINRARRILWVVTGNEKVKSLVQLEHAYTSIPAARIRPQQAF